MQNETDAHTSTQCGPIFIVGIIFKVEDRDRWSRLSKTDSVSTALDIFPNREIMLDRFAFL